MDAVVDPLASTLPPPALLSPSEQDTVLALALSADLAAELVEEETAWANPVKVCSCGREHDAAAWKALPYVGVQDDVDCRFELRNCVCGSTIAVMLCVVEACPERPTWRVENLRDYCEAHTNEWLRAEAEKSR